MLSKKNMLLKIIPATLAAALAITIISCSTQTNSQNKKITKNEIATAQQSWGQALVSIGKAHQQHKNYIQVARKAISNLYAYNIDSGTVLFKPTKTTTTPFRGTAKSALSYFVGGNKSYAEDKGFALAPWKKVVFKNDKFYFHNDIAIVMGTYTFINTKNKKVPVKYTFGYVKDKDGKLKIFLQHSSLPYQP